MVFIFFLNQINMLMLGVRKPYESIKKINKIICNPSNMLFQIIITRAHFYCVYVFWGPATLGFYLKDASVSELRNVLLHQSKHNMEHLTQLSRKIRWGPGSYRPAAASPPWHSTSLCALQDKTPNLESSLPAPPPGLSTHWPEFRAKHLNGLGGIWSHCKVYFSK